MASPVLLASHSTQCNASTIGDAKGSLSKTIIVSEFHFSEYCFMSLLRQTEARILENTPLFLNEFKDWAYVCSDIFSTAYSRP